MAMSKVTSPDGLPLDDVNNDPFPLDPSASRNALTGGIQGVTDPTVKSQSSDPAGAGPIPTNPDRSQVGSGTPFAPGASAPSSAPAGFHWDPNLAMFQPNAQAANASSANDPAAMIDALFQQFGITDGGRGSGFADRAYWLENPSEILNGRLAADLAGTGSDQPTGTPGTGPWQNSGRQAGGGGGAGPSAPPVAAPPVPSAIGASVGPDSGTSAFNEQIRSILLSQIAGLSGPTTADSPDVAPAISAFNTQSQRDQATNRDALAERFYASGEGGNALKSGGFNTAVQQGLEKSAGDRANFTGSTILQASQQKRQQLQQMLQTATNAGLTDAAQQIQSKIAAIDADLRRQGLTQQNSQFGDSLGLSFAQLISQQNRDALLAGLRG